MIDSKKDSPLKKYLWLIKLLNENDALSFEEINEKWLLFRRGQEDENIDYSKRTFHHHINAIRNEFGIDIVCGEGYKYYIDTPKREVRSQIERLSMLELLSETVGDSRLSQNLFIYDYFDIFRDKAVMAMMDGIKTRHKVTLDFGVILLPEEKYKVLTVAPYQLQYICSHWYVIGDTDEFGLMRIPLFFCFGGLISNESYNYPTDYSPEKYRKMIYGTANDRIQLTILIIELHPERLNLSNFPLPFQEEFEYGTWEKEGCKYKIKIDFDLPKTPFALHVLKSRLDLFSYTIMNEPNPFDLFTEDEYHNEVFYPTVL